MNSESNENANKLIHENSPYLQQHAHNPVEWYPWGEEALEKAKQEDKPIIVSIGYSSCHWCHVMEHESFEQEDVARIMNENFINIKVDREERPDVDQVYLEAVQSMGMQAGWPLNVFITPEQKPFYGGTYFPKANWIQLLNNVAEVYKNKREDLEKSAEALKQNLSKSDTAKFQLASPGKISEVGDIPAILDEIYQTTASRFDKEYGGNAQAPKFPMPSNWLFLLRYHHITKNEEALKQIKLTLDQMAAGGIYDQIGGGFSRYSVDEKWFVPHFEKMLYDNGQLISLYSEAFNLTGEENYRQVITETISFLEREMMSDEGGFFSALDADSEGVEGKYYIWTSDEIDDILGDDAAPIRDYYNVTPEGNWENGYNILHRHEATASLAQKHNMDVHSFNALVAKAKEKLLRERNKRVRPGLDDKILSGWNGLVLKGLTDAFTATGDENYLNLALKNAGFLEKNMIYKQSGGETALWRKYKNGKAAIEANLEDYAFVIDAFTALYEVTFEEKWLLQARKLTDYTLTHFYDENEDFFFYTDDSSDRLIARKKELFDNVIPSSNSAMALNLYNLGLILDKEEYKTKAENMVAKMVKLIRKEPVFLSNWGRLLTAYATPTAEIAIVGPEAQNYAKDILQHYYPNKVLTGTDNDSDLPLLQGREPANGQTTIYVCYNKACQLPVTKVEDALKQMEEAR